jgi:hypothetical protein
MTEPEPCQAKCAVGSITILFISLFAAAIYAHFFRWMKRVGMDNTTTHIQMFSDTPQLEWMKRYSAVANDEQWSMSILVFCTNGIIQKVLRKVDPTQASELVMDLVQSLDEEEEEED